MKAAESKANTDSNHAAKSSVANQGKSHFFANQTEMQKMFFGPQTIQPRLKIGQPDDKYEHEADRVADAVMRMPDPEVQRPSEEKEEELQMKQQPEIQRKCEECEEEKLQKKAEVKTSGSGKSFAGQQLSNRIKSTAGNGHFLPGTVQSEMAQKMGMDFSRVNVHTGSDAHHLNQQLGARAFTHGSNIYFNEGEYKPASNSGKRLLAHELTHVVQQSRDLSNYSLQLQEAPAGVGNQQPDPVEQEWNAHPDIHHHFHNGLDSYRNLRPAYQAEGIQNPARYLDNNITWVRFFGHGTPIHQDLQQPLNNAEQTLQNNLPAINKFWGFVPRLTSGGNLSNHALGRAIDIDSRVNPHIQSNDDIRVIDMVTGVDLGEPQDQQTMRAASQQFQRQFGDEWIQQKSEELEALNNFMGPLSDVQTQRKVELQQLLESIENRQTSLNEYANEGFLNLQQSLIDAFTGAGFEWGGEWNTEKDFMHFEID